MIEGLVNGLEIAVPEFLVGFTYHEPESYTAWRRGIAEDFESSTAVWITAETPAEALAWGRQVAEALHRRINADQAADWSGLGHSCWLEESPGDGCWSHCLDFFPRVRAEEMPPLERMGTEAFQRWQRRPPKT